jgi:prepilin-type N-terminal cleavage/methylation domain-containing protein
MRTYLPTVYRLPSTQSSRHTPYAVALRRILHFAFRRSPSTVYRLPSTRSRRQAFTLIELLLVILIIGMLVALVSAAAVRAVGAARNAQITVEIGLLDAAMQTYKNDTAGAYPPDCSLMGTGTNLAVQAADVNTRRNRIINHFRKAFPRLIVPGGYCDSSGNATQGTLQWMSQQAYAQSTQYSALFNGTKAPNGVSKWGDMDNLDPGEALVFFLGGFALPNQDNTGKWSFTLLGFSANKVGNANGGGPNQFGPFNLDVTSRSKGPFEFTASRLGDADGDGWPEYYPPYGSVAQPPGTTSAVANPMPPYVYFDATNYGSLLTPTSAAAGGPPSYPPSAVYPSPLASTSGGGNTTTPGAQPTASVNGAAAAWGTAVPYVQTIPSSANMTWVNPDKYQIVSSGLDLMYWFDPSGVFSNTSLRVYPLGTYYSQGDLDNLTNFFNSTLGSAQP